MASKAWKSLVKSYASLNHVVPAVSRLGPYGTHSEECAFLCLGTCAFMYNCNANVSPGWMECKLCDQWVHDICFEVQASRYSQNDDFPCGCDALRDGLLPLKSVDFYTSLKIENLELDFKTLIKRVKTSVSLRNDLFRRGGLTIPKLFLRCGRFGPFSEEFVDDVNEALLKHSPPSEQALVPDLYMPEVLLHIIMCQEDVNRLLAELVLKQY